MTTKARSIDPALRDFCVPADKALRICCYGSSSSSTPERYLDEAYTLGYLLAQRGHTCVNGAGSFGCMAAMNDGAAAGEGHIVGVIHEMWLIDSSDWGVTLRDGGAHGVFGGVEQSHGGPHAALSSTSGPRREMLVAGGKDLQERKRLLVEGADALIVLPGGPGTWDELWEMACARNIGLTRLPIVCVNVDGYYEPFRAMLERAHEDCLTKLEPQQIVHFEDTAAGAIAWVEAIQSSGDKDPQVILKKRGSALRKESVLHVPILGRSDAWFLSPERLRQSLSRASSWVAEASQSFLLKDKDASPNKNERVLSRIYPLLRYGLTFGAGLSVGLAIRTTVRPRPTPFA